MNILFLADNYPPEVTANARIVDELSQEWSKLGHNVKIITSHPNFPEGRIFKGHRNLWIKKEKNHDVSVTRVKTYMAPNEGVIKRIIDFLSFMVTSFIVGCKETKIDLILAISPQFFTLISGALLGIIKRKPYVIILCDLWPDAVLSLNLMRKSLLMRFVKKCELWVYKRASVIVCLSPYFKKYLIQNGIDEAKIVISISGVDTNKFSARPKNSALINKYNLDNQFIIGYLGTMGLLHEFDSILAVATKFQKQGNNTIKFLFIGSGAQRKYLAECLSKLNLQNVILREPVPLHDMPDYLSLIDVSFVPLKNIEINRTVIPSKMLEAMAMGKPIILYSPEGEAQLFLQSANAGIFAPSGNISKLEDALLKLYSDSEQYLKFSQNGTRYSSDYTRAQQAQDLIKVFSLLSEDKLNEFVC